MRLVGHPKFSLDFCGGLQTRNKSTKKFLNKRNSSNELEEKEVSITENKWGKYNTPKTIDQVFEVTEKTNFFEVWMFMDRFKQIC